MRCDGYVEEFDGSMVDGHVMVGGTKWDEQRERRRERREGGEA
jgi:hypothetical protein